MNTKAKWFISVFVSFLLGGGVGWWLGYLPAKRAADQVLAAHIGAELTRNVVLATRLRSSALSETQSLLEMFIDDCLIGLDSFQNNGPIPALATNGLDRAIAYRREVPFNRELGEVKRGVLVEQAVERIVHTKRQ